MITDGTPLAVLDTHTKTPELDKLARDGVRFENTFVTTPSVLAALQF